jgi:hypothetical protein
LFFFFFLILMGRNFTISLDVIVGWTISLNQILR